MHDDRQRVVIFGGSGFIGTWLTERLLSAGWEVRIADLVSSSKFPDLAVQCDVRDEDQVFRACQNMDVIHNLAAEHVDNVRPLEKYQHVNVDGTRNICRAAEEVGIQRLIFASTVAVYGLPDRELDETAEPKPFNEYGRTKLLAEEVCREWMHRGKDRALAIVRPTAVFGKDNRGNFYNLLRQIASGRFVMIGSGRNRKSIAYVENVAAFFEFVMQFGSGEHLFNYADEPDMEMNELVPLVLAQLGKNSRSLIRVPYWLGYAFGRTCDAAAWTTGRRLAISSVRVRKFCASTRFSARKAREAGFTPPVELTTAIKQTIDAEFPSAAPMAGHA